MGLFEISSQSGYSPYVGDFIPADPGHLGLVVIAIVILLICIFKFR